MSVNSIMTRLEGDYSSLKRSLTQVNRDIKLTTSEFQAASAAVSKTNTTLEQLESKNQSAAKAVEAYNQKLEQLKTLQEAVSKQKGVDSYEYKELTTEINKAIKALNDYKNEVEQTTAQIEKMGTKSALTWDKVSSGLKSMRNVGVGMSAAITTPLVMFGKNAVQSYVDAQETEDLFRVSLGGNASKAEDFANEKASQMPQIDPLTMKENIAVMYEMTNAMGATSTEALQMSQDLAMLAEDLGSLKNVDASVAFDKLRSAMSGESEPLKQWGYIINDTNVKQWALTNGLIEQGEELDDAQKAWARYNLILEKTKTAQGNLLETGDSPANQIKATKAELAEVSRDIGEKLLPILTDLLGVVDNVLDAWNNLSDGTQENIIKFGLITAAAGPMISALSQVTMTVGNLVSKLSSASKEAGGFKNMIASLGSSGGSTGLMIAAAAIAVGTLWNSIEGYRAEKEESYNKEIEDQLEKEIAAINASYEALSSPDSQLLETTQKNSQKKIKADQEYYNEKIKNASKAEQAARKAIQEETEAYRKGYNERIELIEAEYNAKMEAVEQEEQKRLKQLQAQIDQIDAQTEAEEKAEKEKENAQKEQQLKQNVAAAKTAEQRKEAQNELNKFYEELEKERIAEEREALKESLKNQMEKIQEETTVKKDALQAELEKARETEQLKLDIFTEKQEQRLEALDGYAERETERLTALRDSAVKLEQERTAQVAAEIQKRIDKYNEEKEAAVKAAQERAELEKSESPFLGFDFSDGFFNGLWQGIKGWFNSFASDYDPISENPVIKQNYTGDPYWRGGLTRVHDKFGGEIINLPNGSQIIPHDISAMIADAAGKSVSSASGGNLTASLPINVYIGGERIYSKVAQAQLRDQTARKRGRGI